MRRISLLVAVGLAVSGCSYTTQLIKPNAAPEASKIFWGDGAELATIASADRREPVKLKDISPLIQDAVIAIEDERFYEHKGVDFKALIRALRANTETGEVVQGGSTITQQYVRNVVLESQQKTVDRKVREAILAWQFERTYTKGQILEGYLNVAYFGHGAYGVQSAAKVFFATSANSVTLAQAATLAGLLQSPEGYNPYENPSAAIERRNVVLHKMAETNTASAADVEAAKAEPLILKSAEEPTGQYAAGHYVEQVKHFILNDPAFGETLEQRRKNLLTGGLRIHTGLDPDLQSKAEKAIDSVLSPDTGPSGSLVATDPRTGIVKAYVGGRDFWGTESDSKFDFAGQGLRQPGSSFKPFVLAAALNQGIGLSKKYDAPGELTIPLPNDELWEVRNYDGSGRGSLDLTEATVKSVNTVYAQLIMDVGPQAVIDLASEMGIRSQIQAYPSSALGTNEVTVLDMASAYSSLAGDGLHIDPVFVTKVTKKNGELIYEAPTNRSRVLDKNVSRQVTGVLEQVIQRGTGTRAKLDVPAAGKTGTAEEWRDAWFCGYTPQLSTAVWVGFPQALISMVPPTTSIKVAGGTWPTEIWHAFMSKVDLENLPFPDPEAAPSTTATTAADTRPIVPDVVGLTLANAQTKIADAGFKFSIKTKASRDTEPNAVISQSPSGLSRAKEGSTITVTVSSGPPVQVVMPSLDGFLADAAAARLATLGLEIDVQVGPESSPVPADRGGLIWNQSVAPGAYVDVGTTITVSVNPGSPTTTTTAAT